LEIYDITGDLLIRSQQDNVSTLEYFWDGRDFPGHRVAPGVYSRGYTPRRRTAASMPREDSHNKMNKINRYPHFVFPAVIYAGGYPGEIPEYRGGGKGDRPGEELISLADDASAVYWNPAGSPR